MPSNLSDFSLLWCLISTESKYWFCATKSVWFFWATSALVSLQFVSVNFVPLNLFDFSEWHFLWCLISTDSECWFFCQKICLVLLSNICFGVWSLQGVSVDFVPPNMFNFADQHLFWHLISTASECWFCASKYVQFCWVTSAFLSDLYRQCVLILCHQICLIFLCFCVQYLQKVSVDFVLPNMFDFSEWLWCLISTGSGC